MKKRENRMKEKREKWEKSKVTQRAMKTRRTIWRRRKGKRG